MLEVGEAATLVSCAYQERVSVSPELADRWRLISAQPTSRAALFASQGGEHRNVAVLALGGTKAEPSPFWLDTFEAVLRAAPLFVPPRMQSFVRSVVERLPPSFSFPSREQLTQDIEIGVAAAFGWQLLGWRSLCESLERDINFLLAHAEDELRGRRVYLAGHSLGGFRAEVLAMLFDLPCFSFESPGVLSLRDHLRQQWTPVTIGSQQSHPVSPLPSFENPKILSYCGAPNFINTAGGHVHPVFRVVMWPCMDRVYLQECVWGSAARIGFLGGVAALPFAAAPAAAAEAAGVAATSASLGSTAAAASVAALALQRVDVIPRLSKGLYQHALTEMRRRLRAPLGFAERVELVKEWPCLSAEMLLNLMGREAAQGLRAFVPLHPANPGVHTLSDAARIRMLEASVAVWLSSSSSGGNRGVGEEGRGGVMEGSSSVNAQLCAMEFFFRMDLRSAAAHAGWVAGDDEDGQGGGEGGGGPPGDGAGALLSSFSRTLRRHLARGEEAGRRLLAPRNRNGDGTEQRGGRRGDTPETGGRQRYEATPEPFVPFSGKAFTLLDHPGASGASVERDLWITETRTVAESEGDLPGEGAREVRGGQTEMDLEDVSLLSSPPPTSRQEDRMSEQTNHGGIQIRSSPLSPIQRGGLGARFQDRFLRSRGNGNGEEEAAADLFRDGSRGQAHAQKNRAVSSSLFNPPERGREAASSDHPPIGRQNPTTEGLLRESAPFSCASSVQPRQSMSDVSNLANRHRHPGASSPSAPSSSSRPPQQGQGGQQSSLSLSSSSAAAVSQTTELVGENQEGPHSLGLCVGSALECLPRVMSSARCEAERQVVRILETFGFCDHGVLRWASLFMAPDELLRLHAQRDQEEEFRGGDRQRERRMGASREGAAVSQQVWGGMGSLLQRQDEQSSASSWGSMGLHSAAVREGGGEGGPSGHEGGGETFGSGNDVGLSGRRKRLRSAIAGESFFGGEIQNADSDEPILSEENAMGG